uniref:Heat shock 70 kDa protein, mitochondrial (Trinotate prediction) n=1 Tax=Henneguya salminicola TaxID=69463 RepID=A0A6G3MHZ2_HENSL
MGAAVQGGVLVGSVSDIVLVDVTPYSLGVKTLNDVFSIIVPRNTSIPTKKTETYTTSEDNQTRVSIEVYQGERSLCNDNLPLGTFDLSGFPARPKGATRICVAFELDSNGIASISAMDNETGIKADAVIKSNPRGLSKDELEKIAKEAEKERKADSLKKAIATAKTSCESTLYDCRQFINRDGQSVPSEDLQKFQTHVDEFAASVIPASHKDEKFYLDKNNQLIVELGHLKSAVINHQKDSSQQPDKNDTSPDQTQNPN